MKPTQGALWAKEQARRARRSGRVLAEFPPGALCECGHDTTDHEPWGSDWEMGCCQCMCPRYSATLTA